jgi:Xaa-Pro aminopeptidase
MAQNLTTQILKEHLADGELKPGRSISLKVDQALLQDATGTMALMQFEELGVPRVKVDRAVQYVDHNVVALDYKNPDDHRMLQALTRKHGLHFSRPGNGISHYVHMERFGKPANLNKAYVRLRMIKSAEELDWLRIGAHFSDLGMTALRDGLRPGLTERELGDLVERAYVAQGATNVIHYFGVTPMRAPQLAVPAQFPSTRRVQGGDIVFAEISAAFWDYPGQVLRSFALGAPTPLHRDLHAAADAAFDAIAAVLRDGALPRQVIEAGSVIEDAGFTTIDDLLHGYGGGYLPPILGSASRPAGPVPDEPFRAGMTVVIQPNVVTKDGKAGVQTGEMVLITESGIERMHAMPRGFLQIRSSS